MQDDGKRKRAEIIAGVAVAIAIALVLFVALDVIGDIKTMVVTPTPTRTVQPSPAATLAPVQSTQTPITWTVVTAVETITPVPTECVLDAEYVDDVTIPDGTVMEPGEVFTKTWLLQNTGTCALSGAELAFVGWTRMTEVESVPISDTEPSGEVQVSVVMTAPIVGGNYIGVWAVSVDKLCFCNVTVDILVEEKTSDTTDTD